MSGNKEYIEYFLNARACVALVECLEIRHSEFSQTWRVVRNVSSGVTVAHEDGHSFDYEYWPLEIRNLGARDDIDFGIKVNLGDLGEIVPMEIRRVLAGDAVLEKPIVTYRSYRSDDYSKPLEGPLRLEIKKVSYTKEGCSFEAKAPSLNISRTGEIYALDRFPSLRGFL